MWHNRARGSAGVGGHLVIVIYKAGIGVRLNYHILQSRYRGTTQSVRNSMSQTLRTLPRGFPIISCSTHFITAIIIVQLVSPIFPVTDKVLCIAVNIQTILNCFPKSESEENL